MKRSFLEVRAGSRELENEKNQNQTQNYTKPTPKPKHLPFELMKRPFQTNPNQILLKLMKRSFLEVRVGSRELENEKTKTNTKPTPKPKHLPFELIKNPSKQIQTIFKLMK